MILNILLYTILFFLLLIYYELKKKKTNNKNRFDSILYFDKYISVFNYIAEKCYMIVYTDKILSHSLDSQRLDDEDFNIAVSQFTELFFKYCGKNLLEEFIFLYGDKDTLVFVLVEYFNDKYQHDEIFDQSQDEFINNSLNKTDD